MTIGKLRQGRCNIRRIQSGEDRYGIASPPLSDEKGDVLIRLPVRGSFGHLVLLSIFFAERSLNARISKACFGSARNLSIRRKTCDGCPISTAMIHTAMRTFSNRMACLHPDRTNSWATPAA